MSELICGQGPDGKGFVNEVNEVNKFIAKIPDLSQEELNEIYLAINDELRYRINRRTDLDNPRDICGAG
jgi:hypothetical protein